MQYKPLDVSEEELARMIKDTKRDLKDLTKRRRKDYGTSRAKYSLSLPLKYRSYLMRANQKSLNFELSVEEFELITNSPCCYCGSTSKIGVDRAQSKEGYTVDNSRPCCTTCNMMKYTYSPDVFMSQIKKIHDHLNLSKKHLED